MPAWAFQARATTAPDPDPITFTVAGREFRCVPMAPAAAWETLTGLPTVPPAGDPGFRAAVITVATLYATAIRYCLEPADQPRWDDLIRTTYLDEDFYADCAIHLLQEYTDRISVADTGQTAPIASEGHPGTNQDDLDPVTLRQIELDRAAYDPEPDPGEGLPPHLAALLQAGGGFTLPT